MRINHYPISLKIFFLILFFYPRPLSDKKILGEFIIWNVGQGQWTTWVNESSCVHFDSGGEKIPWSAIYIKCSGRNNILNFTHKDTDHTGGAYKFYKMIKKNTCLLTPITIPPYPEKFNEIPKCIDFPNDFYKQENSKITILDPPIQMSPKNANFHSHIYLLKNMIIPGDSTKKAEKFWVPKIPMNVHYTKLILGHHGSKTSTSPLLLNSLPHLNQCVSSSRKAKYGHPNKETLELLKLKKCPHLSTEIWGHIHFLNY